MRPSPSFFAFRARRAARALALAAVLAAVLAAAAAPLRAQGGDQGFVTPFSSIFISAGKLLMDVSRLNPRFERPDLALLLPPQHTGFDAISNNGFSIGAGGYTPVGRVLLGGELQYADFGEESSPAGKTDRLETSYGMATVGYAVFSGWRFTVYPFLGVGAGQVTLTLKSRNGVPQSPLTSDPAFDDIVLGNVSESKLTGSYVIVQPGLGFDYLALRNTSSHVGLVLGVRFSSAISPHHATWSYAGRSVFGAPDVGPSGTMLRLVVGIGGFRVAK